MCHEQDHKLDLNHRKHQHGRLPERGHYLNLNQVRVFWFINIPGNWYCVFIKTYIAWIGHHKRRLAPMRWVTIAWTFLLRLIDLVGTLFLVSCCVELNKLFGFQSLLYPTKNCLNIFSISIRNMICKMFKHHVIYWLLWLWANFVCKCEVDASVQIVWFLSQEHTGVNNN